MRQRPLRGPALAMLLLIIITGVVAFIADTDRVRGVVLGAFGAFVAFAVAVDLETGGRPVSDRSHGMAQFMFTIALLGIGFLVLHSLTGGESTKVFGALRSVFQGAVKP